MELTNLLSFLGASILLTLMPGPDNIYVLTESLTKGQRQGILISIGLCTGVLIHTLAAATGLSLLLQQSDTAYTILKYAGAAYLAYLAYLAYREERQAYAIETSSISAIKQDWFPLVKKGFFMNVLNPKVSLFFIAFLPQFITPDGLEFAIQMILLGFIFMIQAILIFSLIAILAGKLVGFINQSQFWNITRWAKVIILLLLAIFLALSEN